jgi:hypothetical protein
MARDDDKTTSRTSAVIEASEGIVVTAGSKLEDGEELQLV